MTALPLQPPRLPSVRAGEVVPAVEIVSVGSQRIDRVVRHDAIADAGISHHWIIDIEERPSLIACHRAGAFGYVDAPAVSGAFATEEPFPIRPDLDRSS